jgi:signal transduction histidine kinase
MELENLIIIIAGFLSLLLPVYHYGRDRESASNRIFVILSIITGPAWAVTIAMFREAQTVDIAFFWARLIYVVAVLIGLLFYLFAKNFPRQHKMGVFWDILVYSIGIIAFYLILFTERFVTGVKLNDVGNHANLGFGYTLWLIWMASIFAIGGAIIIRDYSKLRKVERNQLKYFVIGILLPAFGVFPTNAILPLFGVYQYIWAGPIFMVLMNLILAYGATRTRFIGMDFVWGWIVRLITLGGILYGMYFGVSKILISTIGDIFSTQSLIVGGVLAIGAAFIIKTSVDWIENNPIRLFIKGGYNGEKIRDRFVRQTSTELDIDKITTVLLSTIYRVWGIESAGLVLLNGESEKIIYKKYKRFSKIDVQDLVEVMVYWDEQLEIGEPLVYSELEYKLYNQIGNPSPKESERMNQLLRFMDKHKIAVIFKLSQRLSFNGLLMVGTKQGGKVFTVDDISLIKTLANNAELAIGRALLYSEVRDFNQQLQRKVDEATKEIREQKEALEETLRKERDMLDIMGHELRTPLTIVRNAVDIVLKNAQKEPPVIDKIRHWAESAKEAVTREIRILESLLSTTKIDKENVSLMLGETDVASIAKSSVEGLRNEAERKGLQINLKVEGGGRAYADSAKVAEIFHNLIDNAIKYTEAGEVSVNVYDRKDKVFIEVQDTGTGIPKKDIPKLGRKFFRSNQYIIERKKSPSLVRPGGTGLGLFVVYNYTKLMGGKVNVESEVGKGSTFRVTLPKFTGQEVIAEKKVDSKDRFAKFRKRDKKANPSGSGKSLQELLNEDSK